MSSGTIITRKTKAGEVRYLPKYDAGRDADGKRLQRYGKTHATKKAAQQELRQLLATVDDGTHVDRSQLTLRQWAAQWLESLAIHRKVSARTHEGYADWINLHVLPTLGDLELQKITTLHIDRLYTDLLTSGHLGKVAKGDEPKERGLSQQTVLHVHRTLFQCLKAASRKRLIARNPAEDAEAPNPERTRSHASEEEGAAIRPFTREECAQLLDGFEGKPLRPLVALGLATGLRRGELLALRWSAIDLEKRTLRVDVAIEKTRAHGLRFKAPKNKSSRRTLGLDAGACEVLKRNRAQQRETALRLGVPYPADALLFPCVIKRAKGKQPATLHGDADFARPWDPAAITKEFSRGAAAAGLAGHTLHDLRHTHATMLLIERVPVHVVAKRLGHSTPAITMKVYAHVIPEGADQAVAAAGSLLQSALRISQC